MTKASRDSQASNLRNLRLELGKATKLIQELTSKVIALNTRLNIQGITLQVLNSKLDEIKAKLEER